MLNKLIKRNELLIIKYKDNLELSKKHQLIKKILATKNCFFKMNIETAYSILTDLGVKKDKLKSVYIELMNSDNYKE